MLSDVSTSHLPITLACLPLKGDTFSLHAHMFYADLTIWTKYKLEVISGKDSKILTWFFVKKILAIKRVAFPTYPAIGSKTPGTENGTICSVLYQ